MLYFVSLVHLKGDLTILIRLNMIKELPRVNRAQDQVQDEKSQLLSFSGILNEFCSILVKIYKNVHFTEY